MLSSEINVFFQGYFENLAKKDVDEMMKFHHTPCIFMDRTDFIPISSGKIISRVFSELIETNFQSQNLEVRSFEIDDINNASETLSRVKLTADIINLGMVNSRYCQIMFTMMKKNDAYKIITSELLNLKVPEIPGLTHNKSHEVDIKFYKYAKTLSKFS